MANEETTPATARQEVAASDHDTLVDRSANVASGAAAAFVITSTGTANTMDDAPTTTTTITYRQFWQQFTTAHGAVELLVISTIFAVGIGSVLGLVRSQCACHVNSTYTRAACGLSLTHTFPVGMAMYRFPPHWRIGMRASTMALTTRLAVAMILPSSHCPVKPVPTRPNRPRRGRMSCYRRSCCSSIPLWAVSVIQSLWDVDRPFCSA
jgi:hypothetical protein